jgi:hypothetical protein
MPTAYTRYVTWISRGKRHHGSTSMDVIPPIANDPKTMFSSFAAPSMGWNDMNGDLQTGKFAFWSVTGASDGPFVSTQNTVHAGVGSSDIHATAWYIPEGGGGPGGPGLTIDAFDVALGNFVDDDFVDVVSDPALTLQANNDGFVPTVSAEDVRSYTAIHSVPFEDWTVIPMPDGETVSARDLEAAPNTSAIAFAFYQPAKKGSSGRRFDVTVPSESTWVSWGVMVDGGGPTGRGPVDPWGPLIRQLAAGLALADAVSMVERDLRAPLADLAARQVESSARNIARSIELHAEQPLAIGAQVTRNLTQAKE